MANAKETSSAYTPGPWIVQDNGEIKAEATIGKWDDYICTMPFSSMKEAREMGADQISNARLIAAAPELLEACETLVDIAGSVAGNWENGRALAVAVQNLVRHAKAASGVIAKAKSKPA